MNSFLQQIAERDKDTVYCHREYFDAGALHYEQLPVLGRAMAWLKRRMG
jgi:hypothetical protein